MYLIVKEKEKKNVFLLENANHHLNLQQVVIFFLVGSLALILMAADSSGWWMKAGVAEGIS